VAAATTGWRWRDLEREHRRWVIVNALLVTAAVNLILNGAIAWFSVRGQHVVPVWAIPRIGSANVFTDTVGTFFFLPLMTCVFSTTFVWVEMRAGRLPPLTTVEIPDRLRGGRLRRGAVLGAATAAVLTPIAAVVFLLVGTGAAFTVGQFVVYKAALGVALGAIVTPIIGLCAMAAPAQA